MYQTIYTLAEAAQLLRCHEDTLRRAVREGRLRAAKLGRGYRLSRPDLEEFWIAQGGGTLFSLSSDAAEEENNQNESSDSPVTVVGNSIQAGHRRSEPELRQLSLIAPLGGSHD